MDRRLRQYGSFPTNPTDLLAVDCTSSGKFSAIDSALTFDGCRDKNDTGMWPSLVLLKGTPQLVLLYQQALFSVKYMNSDFIHKARGVSDLKCHLVLTTKYRRKVLTDLMLSRLEEIFQNLMEKWEGRLVEFKGERDHVHLLLQYTPQTEPSKLINNLKTVSSRYLRKEFVAEVETVYGKDFFWTNGYFIASYGGVTVEHLKKYIEEQV